MRTLKPRQPVSCVPLAVSQLTCEAMVGINASRYLELLGDHPEVPRATVGQLRVVQVDDMRVLLDRLRTNAGQPVATSNDDGQPRTAADVLATIGRRATR